MNIAGLVKTSLVDYPGKIAAVIFTQGCNFRCTYCHNSSLLEIQAASSSRLSAEDIGKFLAQRQGLLDAVVISGGEPTLQQDLPIFVKQLKKLNLLIKLDTNGTNPDSLKTLIGSELLDFIAMDLKAPFSKYEKITGTNCLETAAIRESAEIIKRCGIAHEFRTTFCPELEAEDIAEIIADFKLASNYVVQSCRSKEPGKTSQNRQDWQKLSAWSKKNFPLSWRGFDVD